MSLNREFLATRSKNHKSRKNEKDFLFFWEKACFSSSWLQKSSKFLAKKEVLNKNHIISERSEDGLSSYVLISILKFLKKIDFFLVGRWGTKKHATVYFLMFFIHSIIRVVLYGSLLASNIYWKYFSKILKNSRIAKFSRWYIYMYLPPSEFFNYRVFENLGEIFSINVGS